MNKTHNNPLFKYFYNNIDHVGDDMVELSICLLSGLDEKNIDFYTKKIFFGYNLSSQKWISNGAKDICVNFIKEQLNMNKNMASDITLYELQKNYPKDF